VDVTLAPATRADIPQLLGWLERYYRELSQYTPWLYDEAAPFSYPSIDSYWSDPLRHAFLLWHEGEPAGFSLIHNYSHINGSTEVNDIEEFSIFPAHRRSGIGRAFAHRLFGRFSGSWEVRVREANRPGMLFWHPVVAEFASGGYRRVPRVEDGSTWCVYEFAAS